MTWNTIRTALRTFNINWPTSAISSVPMSSTGPTGSSHLHVHKKGFIISETGSSHLHGHLHRHCQSLVTLACSSMYLCVHVPRKWVYDDIHHHMPNPGYPTVGYLNMVLLSLHNHTSSRIKHCTPLSW